MIMYYILAIFSSDKSMICILPILISCSFPRKRGFKQSRIREFNQHCGGRTDWMAKLYRLRSAYAAILSVYIALYSLLSGFIFNPFLFFQRILRRQTRGFN